VGCLPKIIMTVSSLGEGAASPSMGASSTSMPRGRDLVVFTLHQAAVSELVLDRVGVVWALFFKELLEVVCGRSCLALAAAHGLCGALRARATCSLIDATVIIDCGLLVVLFVPLLAGPGTLLGTLDSDARRRFPAATLGRSKMGHLGTGGMMGGDAMTFFGGALGSIGRCVPLGGAGRVDSMDPSSWE
jgi:hypothetical protein